MSINHLAAPPLTASDHPSTMRTHRTCPGPPSRRSWLVTAAMAQRREVEACPSGWLRRARRNARTTWTKPPWVAPCGCAPD